MVGLNQVLSTFMITFPNETRQRLPRASSPFHLNVGFCMDVIRNTFELAILTTLYNCDYPPVFCLPAYVTIRFTFYAKNGDILYRMKDNLVRPLKIVNQKHVFVFASMTFSVLSLIRHREKKQRLSSSGLSG